MLIMVNANAQQVYNVKASPFNAVGDGIVDDKNAIKRAIDSANAWSLAHSNAQVIVYFPATVASYLINSVTQINDTSSAGARLRNYIFPVYSNIKFLGSSTGTSTIKIANGLFSDATDTPIDKINGTGIYRNANLFYGNKNTDNVTPVSNVEFRRLTIDFNGVNNLLPSGQGVSANNSTGRLKTIYGIIFDGTCHDVIIDSMSFMNNPGLNDIVASAPGYNLTIKNSKFLNGGWCVGSPTIMNSNSHDFSFVYSEWNNSLFTKDSLIEEYPEISLRGGNPPSIPENSYAGGIEIHGSNSLMSNNFLYGCKPAVYISSATGRSMNFSVDNIPQKNVRVTNNQMIDCFDGVSFWVKNLLDSVSIDSNLLNIMFLKSSSLSAWYHPYHYIYGIGYGGGNMSCRANYEYQECSSCNNSNLNPINHLTINRNTIVFDTTSIYPSDIVITGIVLHSTHNSVISNNIIKGANWSGLTLEGSPWITKNLNVTGNIFSDFTYSRNSNVAGYIVVTDTYRPNNDCDPNHQRTFRDVNISGNTFTPNLVISEESQSPGFGISGYNYSAFRALFFDLPTWYGYNSIPGSPGINYNSNSFKNGTFSISANTIPPGYPNANTDTWYVTGACPANPCGNTALPPANIRWFDILSDNINTIEEEVSISGTGCLRSTLNTSKCNIGYRLLADGGLNQKWTISYLENGASVYSYPYNSVRWGSAITITRGVDYPIVNNSIGQIKIQVESNVITGSLIQNRYFACLDPGCYNCVTDFTFNGTYSVANTESTTWIKSNIPNGNTTIKNTSSVRFDAEPNKGYVEFKPTLVSEFFLAEPATEIAMFSAQALDGCGGKTVSRSLPLVVETFRIYPNPATESFTVISGKALPANLIQLFDINGKRQSINIQIIAYNKVLIQCNNLGKGIYLIKVIDKSHTEVRKIVIL